MRKTLSSSDLSLKTLSEKLDWIIERLSYLEAILTESQKYPEVVDLLRNLKIGTAVYGEPLKTLNSLISARHFIESVPHRDEITRIILNTIALKGPQNVSQLTREVRSQREKASRTTIRKRLMMLIQNKTLIKVENRYRLAE